MKSSLEATDTLRIPWTDYVIKEEVLKKMETQRVFVVRIMKKNVERPRAAIPNP